MGVLEGEHAKLPQKPQTLAEAEAEGEKPAAGGDVEMENNEEKKEHPAIRMISGKSEISFKRDHMKIEPLYG